MKNKLTIEFDTEEAKEQFIINWLEGAEQQFFVINDERIWNDELFAFEGKFEARETYTTQKEDGSLRIKTGDIVDLDKMY